LKTDPEKAVRWREFEPRAPTLSGEQKKRVQDYNREINILAMVGIWCGDCVRTTSIIRKIAEAAGEKVNIRFIERETSPELVEELRILGATRVPRIVFLTEDFWEIDRAGDRLLPVYRAKAAREIGMNHDAGVMTPKAIQEEAEAWLDVFERVLLMARLAPPLRKRYND
ncbi:thioredoxin family protein, partial [Candidatus Bathyarchaeota archaeon]|nr:thioredoxin family protein [Candidatus Bathyarchaeota archaeon]